MDPLAPKRLKTIAVLKRPASPGALLPYSRAIVSCMTNNPFFPTPRPSLATIQAAIDDLDAAQTAVLQRTIGNAKLRDTKKAGLVEQLEHLRAYVQEVADADPEHAREVVLGAGMSVKGPPIRITQTFFVRQGRVSGMVELAAKAVHKRASYYWEYSEDEVSWNRAGITLGARTVISGLRPERRYFFRFRATTKGRTGPWSDVVSLFVL